MSRSPMAIGCPRAKLARSTCKRSQKNTTPTFASKKDNPVIECDFETIRREETPQAERIAQYLRNLPWTRWDTKILDVGCGPGIYTEALRRIGFDAEGCDLDSRLPDAPWFHRLDLTRDSPSRIYDLVLSLEVGEHLPQESASYYVNFIQITGAHTVYFSAARPGQGGHGHINCRLKNYWSRLFAFHNFYFDPEATEAFIEWMRNGYHMGWLVQNGVVFRRV
jgi:SAM-dependent methyltransferase